MFSPLYSIFSPPRYPLIGLLLLCPLGRAATDVDYLLQIEAAAKRQAATPIINSTTPLPNIPADTDRLPSGLQTQEEFEKALREQFAGTYAFYQRLTAEGKKQIYTLYRQDNRVNAIREQTLQLLAGDSG
jgi:hypothetical protein